MTLDAALKVIARLKWCIRDQRRRLNDMKRRYQYMETRYYAMDDRYARLQCHANSCCTCGNQRH